MLYPFVADERSFRLYISECYLFVRIQRQTILRLKKKKQTHHLECLAINATCELLS